MNTVIDSTKSTHREMTHRPLAEEQEAALERLLTLLAASAPEAQAPHAPEAGTDALLQLARLRAAHATYSLETIGGMERVGAGAWVRRPPRRPVAH
jgi:hypothetical protein